MIVLDTNVISEIMRPAPSRAVLEWLRALPPAELATTTISIAEIRYGLARLDPGERRTDLESRFSQFLVRGFGGRIFDFDLRAAEIYGDLVAERERMGKRIEGFDGLIAAIARARGLSVATRNVGDFEGCGIAVLSPWE